MRRPRLKNMQESLQIIRRNVELEARLIDDLLDLTRISKGKVQLNFEVVDAHSSVAQRSGDLSCRYRAKSI